MCVQLSAGFDWSASTASQSLDFEFMSLDTVCAIAARVNELVRVCARAVLVVSGVCDDASVRCAQEASVSRRVREGVDAKALCKGSLSLLKEHRKYSASLSAYLESTKCHNEQMKVRACGAVVCWYVCGWLS